MVNANAKTPNKKRKSMGNAGGDSQTAQTPKGGKKGNTTPGKFNKSPKPSPQQNAKSPKQTPFKNQNKSIGDSPGQTPFKRGNANNSAKKQVEKPVQKTKRSSESENDSTPPKKMKMFTGTSDLESSDAKPPQIKTQKKGGKQQKNKGEAQPAKKGKRKSQFYNLKDKAQKGDKEALEKIEAKIQDMLKVKAPTKTAKRKLKFLEKLRRIAKGETEPAAAPQPQKAKAKEAKGKQDQKKQAKVSKPKTPAIQFADDDDAEEESDSSESDYEVDAEIKPDKIIKTGDLDVEEEESEDEDEEDEEDDDDDDDEEEEDEDESDEEEEEVPQLIKVPQGKKNQPKENATPNLKDLQDNQIISKKQSRYIVFVGNLPYDATKHEISEHFTKVGVIRHVRIPTDKQTNKPRGFAYVEFDNEVSYQKALSLHHTFLNKRRINVLYTQGGKKKGEERKNEVKVKNFKLQAMRKQGQLAGSVKQNQKRSARRNKQNAKPVNGGN